MNYNFKPDWKTSLLFVFFCPLFISLGFWQLHRADQVKAIMAMRVQRASEAPISLRGDEPDVDALRFRPVVLAGTYDMEHQFLLDNQVHGQRSGYQVLTPLWTQDSDLVVLVNRGWVPLGQDRSHYPDLSIKQPKVSISGVIERFPGVGFRLKGAELPSAGWPSVVQVVDTSRIAERLGYPVLPYQVLLDENVTEGYVRAWKSSRLTPEKNQGYALQWFLFALVITVLYLRHNITKKK